MPGLTLNAQAISASAWPAASPSGLLCGALRSACVLDVALLRGFAYLTHLLQSLFQAIGIDFIAGKNLTLDSDDRNLLGVKCEEGGVVLNVLFHQLERTASTHRKKGVKG